MKDILFAYVIQQIVSYILEIILELTFIFKLFFFFLPTAGFPTKVCVVLRKHGQTLSRNKNEVSWKYFNRWISAK